MFPTTRALPGAVFAVVLTLTACGGTASPTSSPRTAPAPTSTATATTPTNAPSEAATKPSGAAASTLVNSRFTSTAFAVPVSFLLADRWMVTENVHEDIDLRGPHYGAGLAGDQDIEMHDIGSTTVAGTAKSDPYMPWPTDLYAWLKSRPEFKPLPPQTITVDGRPATQIDADATVPAGTRIELVCVRVFSCWLLDHNDRWRFVELKNSDGSGVVWITNGIPAPGFDAFAQALDQLLGTFEFR